MKNFNFYLRRSGQKGQTVLGFSKLWKKDQRLQSQDTFCQGLIPVFALIVKYGGIRPFGYIFNLVMHSQSIYGAFAQCCAIRPGVSFTYLMLR